MIPDTGSQEASNHSKFWSSYRCFYRDFFFLFGSLGRRTWLLMVLGVVAFVSTIGGMVMVPQRILFSMEISHMLDSVGMCLKLVGCI